jgi:tetratricopeptide (TPR) repeat protein
MDALKKAEEAKRQSEAAAKIEPRESPPAGGGSTEADTRGLPELPSRLELLDHEFHTPAAAKPEPAATLAPAAQPSKQPAADAQERERAAAQNVFVAKQPAQNRNLLIVGGMAAVLAAVGIGGWVWWEMQPKGGLGTTALPARTAPIASAPIAPAPPVAAMPATPAPAAPAESAAAPPSGDEPAAVPPALTLVPASGSMAFAEKPAARKPAPAAAPEAPAAEPESPIRITTSRLKVNPQIASAYQAFLSGDLATAQRDYQQVLKSEPKNINALHGLAAISLRQGQYEAAENLYLHILEADPKDSAAQAGLIGLKGQVDPIQSESRLKNLLAGQPESPSLNFALGNLYAQQGRWNDAQQAYFRAYTSDSENPDYQFNLAVSLDQLRQPRLALQYYQGALAAATQRPAAFDRNQVAGRVSDLQK